MTEKEWLAAWQCGGCGGIGKHLRGCDLPDGRCRRCRYPLDDHKNFATPQMACPNTSVAA